MAASQKDISLWQGGIIAYEVDGNLARMDLLISAIEHLETVTSLRFVKRHVHLDYVLFRSDADSPFTSTDTGKGEGKQIISVSADNRGAYLHEIGHAIGLIHEVRRSDRDDYVILHHEHIPDNRERDFRIVLNSINSSLYDFFSIMHYSGEIDGAIRISSITGVPLSKDMGRKDDLTATDIAFINRLYPFIGVIRRGSGDRGAGPVTELALVTSRPSNGTSTSEVITAVKNQSGDLQLMRWYIDETGNVLRESDPDLDHGVAADIHLIRIDRHIIGCMCNAAGSLYLISWTRDLVKEADSGSMAGKATHLRIMHLSDEVFLTSCNDATGKLKLIAWRIATDGTFTRLSDSGTSGPLVTNISLAEVVTEHPTRHFIAVTGQTTAGDIKVFNYELSIPDHEFTLLGDTGTQLGKGGFVSSMAIGAWCLLVACATGPRNELSLIPVSFSRNGRTLNRLSDREQKAGTIKALRMIARPYGFMTAVCTAKDHLKLIKWQYNSELVISRLGDSGDEAGRLIPYPVPDSPVVSTPQDNVPIDIELCATGVNNVGVCSAVRTASGTLKLLSWDDMDPTSGELFREQ